MKGLIWEGGMDGRLKLHTAIDFSVFKLTVNNFSLLIFLEQPTWVTIFNH